MQINDLVKTPDGIGQIVHIEHYSRMGGLKRYGVKLNVQKYFYPVSYYFEDDNVSKIDAQL